MYLISVKRLADVLSCVTVQNHEQLLSCIKKLALSLYWNLLAISIERERRKVPFVEEELIKRAKVHDKEAFSKLMKREGKSMYKVAKSILKNDEDVADAMQETALSCWEKIETLQQEQYFRTWLIRILINHCNAIYRKKSRYVLKKEIRTNLDQSGSSCRCGNSRRKCILL